MEKHHSNPQYFKGKKLQRKIFNQFNIKKFKLIKIVLENKNGKKEKKRRRKITKNIK